ncbi:DUF5707 domain-containing protein [Streptomyces sp. NPDC101249]|uniref:DUF5707 domain-containing protein n=1 Tax=Streptomyces sp. NPDC101249 TaxID=3366140 RepID=UPI0037FCC621
MSKRVLITSLVGVAVVGSVAGGMAVSASAATELAVEGAVARYTPASGGKAPSLTFTADVRGSSGVKSLNVVAWPASSKLDPTEREMGDVDRATCKKVDAQKATCVYAPPISEKEARELAEGTWYVSVLATAGDGATRFVPRAASFEVTR